MDTTLHTRFQIPPAISLAENIISGKLILESKTGCNIILIEIVLEEFRKVLSKDHDTDLVVSTLGKQRWNSNELIAKDSQWVFTFDLTFSRRSRRRQPQFPLYGKFGQQVRRIHQAVDMETSVFILTGKVWVTGESMPFEVREEIKPVIR
ncbi:MAG: hypothetical protein R3C61_23240 [Bacteroidia bacterium]